MPSENPGQGQRSQTPIRVLIADDHPALREGLSALLERQTDLQVVAMAADGQAAVAQVRTHQPDVILMDLRMPCLEGADAVAMICNEWPEARIIILTTYDGDEDIYRALRAGAKGYLLKDAPCEELFTAIRQVHGGQKYIMSQVAQKLTDRFQSSELTDRELEVLQLLVQGNTNRDISEALCVAEGTVKFHIRNILDKLGAGDRTQAVTIALKRGLARL
ncbi:response regulator transcription factor [Nodosilinea sp. LEGE 06152]|uniref:response regulator transcription factor n=1 Tax=Nodosilinea sp. LEGE 06152 TaxID=2777966 RepID=UPI00187F06A2|nr:response regulator transcription factor [Nodosilinea sp. LEGE 06152]MBE9160583.1 response regulator transcription factor [Nodosilinea sp. LEGE 06152]